MQFRNATPDIFFMRKLATDGNKFTEIIEDWREYKGFTNKLDSNCRFISFLQQPLTTEKTTDTGKMGNKFYVVGYDKQIACFTNYDPKSNLCDTISIPRKLLNAEIPENVVSRWKKILRNSN